MKNENLVELFQEIGLSKTAQEAAALIEGPAPATVKEEKDNLDKFGGLVDTLLTEMSKTGADGAMAGAEGSVGAPAAAPTPEAAPPAEAAPAAEAPDSPEEIMAFIQQYEAKVAAGEQPSEEETALYNALKQQMDAGQVPKEASYAHLVEKVAASRILGSTKNCTPELIKAAAKRHNELTKERANMLSKTAAAPSVEDTMFMKLAHAVAVDVHTQKIAMEQEYNFWLKLAQVDPALFEKILKVAEDPGVTTSPVTTANATSDALSPQVRGVAADGSKMDAAIQGVVSDKVVATPPAPVLESKVDTVTGSVSGPDLAKSAAKLAALGYTGPQLLNILNAISAK